MLRHRSGPSSSTLLHRAASMLVLLLACVSTARAQTDGPAPPTGLEAADTAWDNGEQVTLSWELSADHTQPEGESASPIAYQIDRSRTADEVDTYRKEVVKKAEDEAVKVATEAWKERHGLQDWDGNLDNVSSELLAEIRQARAEAKAAANEAANARLDADADGTNWVLESIERAEGDAYESRRMTYIVKKLDRAESYEFRIRTIDTSTSPRTESAAQSFGAALQPSRQFFDGGRFWFLLVAIVFCGAVVFFILIARSGRQLKIRKIGGLEAVDEAVGRATEMGRPVLFVPGIQDVNEVQTIAGITVLSRVAKTAAEYDAKVEVPTARSLVMTTARETVEAAFMAAGRPDAYNQDLIYYVTDEQFGYVAYLSGMMVREKPAACFYMGMFYAESLILAETGNSIGAIQVAGTAQPAQLPFFVAACDYTLIGEEFFAASAYLSGSPEELGSLKGQDVGKVLVAATLVIGTTFATVAEVTGSEFFAGVVEFLRDNVLS